MSTVMMVIAGVTVLMLLAMGCALTMPRRSAAARNLVWHLALSGSIAIALLSPFVPALKVPLPVATGEPSAISPRPSSAVQPSAASSARSDVPLPQAENRGPVSRRSAPARLSLESVLALAWALGALAVAAWYLVGRIGLSRLAARAQTVSDPSWMRLLEHESARAGVGAPVRLLRSPRAGSPLTWQGRGLVVLLPDDAEQWPAERRRVVLAHELAHAARGDHLSQTVASAACALYWFHPLVWLASRKLRAESERACDDRVLAHGTEGSDYALHLLDVARRSHALRYGGMIAIGMARPSQLEGRLLAVLDAQRTRAVPSRAARAAAWVALALIVIPLAAMRPAAIAAVHAMPSLAPALALAPHRVWTADSVWEGSLAATPGGTLDLDLQTGGEVTIMGSDDGRISWKALLSGRDYRDSHVSVQAASGGTDFKSWQQGADRDRHYSTSHRFEIRVPRKYSVHISSAGGALRITNVTGDFSGHTGGGEIELDHVAGHVSLTTGGGDIAVTKSELDGRVSTGGGMVRISDVKGNLKGSSGSGPIIYKEAPDGSKGDLDANTPGALHVNSAGGDLVYDHLTDGSVVTTGGGKIRIGASEGSIRANTGGGDIEIGPVAGSVRTGTGAGTVRVTIIDGGGEEHSVTMTTGLGAAYLTLPSDISADFEIETAYTQSFGRKTKIISDFPLTITETADWDDGQGGTPRKYVRASGTAGSGKSRIKIRVTNGDITIKKGG